MRTTAGISLLFMAFTALAQQPPAAAPTAPGRGRGARLPALRAAEILDDQRVTFRLRAANAVEVVLNGDWPEGRGVKLTKDDQGVWSTTVGPLTPELWYYTFNVDGASVVDPSNANLLRDGTRYMNFFIVPGPQSENYAIRDVPHGNVNIVWYDSPSLKLQRRMYVYTPAGYDTGKQKCFTFSMARAETRTPGITWAVRA
jgi:enterochelin esterase family protein